MQKTWLIYGLCRPFRGVIYVGATNNLKRRLKEHRRRFKGELSVVILEDGIGEGREYAEHQWIELFRDLNVSLANQTDGGESVQTISEDGRARISAFQQGRPKPPGHGAKISKTTKGKERGWSADGRERVRATQFKPGHKSPLIITDDMSDTEKAAVLDAKAKNRAQWDKFTPEERSSMATERNLLIWSSYSEQERIARGKAIAKGQAAKISPAKRTEMGRAGGSAASTAFWAKLSPEERSAEARRRAFVRYAKRREASS